MRNPCNQRVHTGPDNFVQMHRENTKSDADGDHHQKRQSINRADSVMRMAVLLIHWSIEQPTHHFKEVRERQHDTKHGHDHLKGYLFQLPTTIMISATKLTVPGMPIDAIHPTIKQPEMNGILLESPPSDGMSRVCVWS